MIEYRPADAAIAVVPLSRSGVMQLIDEQFSFGEDSTVGSRHKAVLEKLGAVGFAVREALAFEEKLARARWPLWTGKEFLDHRMYGHLSSLTSGVWPHNLLVGVAAVHVDAKDDTSPDGREGFTSTEMSGRLQEILGVGRMPRATVLRSTALVVRGHYGYVQRMSAQPLRATWNGVYELSPIDQAILETVTASSRQTTMIRHLVHRLRGIEPSLVRDRIDRLIKCGLLEVVPDNNSPAVVRIGLLLKQFDQAPSGRRCGLISEIARSIHSNVRPPQGDLVHTTTRLRGSSVNLPSAILNEAARAATALVRIGSILPANPCLREFRRQFVQQYGEHNVVPLVELLDPHLGIGPPPLYRRPQSKNTLPYERDPPGVALLNNLLTDAIRRAKTLVVTDNMIDAICATTPHLSRPPPDSVDLAFAVSRSTSHDIVVSPMVGWDPAGRIASHLVGLESYPPIDIEPSPDGATNGEPAQIVGTPHWGQGMVPTNRSTEQLRLVLSPGSKRSMNDLSPTDLGVEVRGEQFVIRSVEDGREISPRGSNLSNTYFAPNIWRFLDEVGDDQTSHIAYFRLLSTEMSRFPRVRYGRTILAPARWHLPQGVVLLGSNALVEWQAKQGVPDWVRLCYPGGTTEAEDGVLINLRSEWAHQLLRAELRPSGQPPVMIEEVPEVEIVGGSVDHHHVTYIASFTRSPATYHQRITSGQAVTLDRFK